MTISTHVTFVERAGPDAEATLRELAGRLRAQAFDADLLRSRDEAHLHLLVAHGDPVLTPADRDGARVWRFETVSP